MLLFIPRWVSINFKALSNLMPNFMTMSAREVRFLLLFIPTTTNRSMDGKADDGRESLDRCIILFIKLIIQSFSYFMNFRLISFLISQVIFVIVI